MECIELGNCASIRMRVWDGAALLALPACMRVSFAKCILSFSWLHNALVIKTCWLLLLLLSLISNLTVSERASSSRIRSQSCRRAAISG